MTKTCNGCNSSKDVAELRDMPPIPFAAHESAMARSERHNKRLWIVILVLIAALIGTNLAWIIYNSQFEVVETWEQEVVQDAENGENNFIGGDYYGETND